MTDNNHPVSPLRQRMLDDMRLRELGDQTQRGYVRAVVKFTRFLGRSPDMAEAEVLRRFQLHLASAGASATTINATLTGLRFFFGVCLEQPELMRRTSPVRQEHRLPVVPSVEEVTQILANAPGLKYQAALSVAYGAGLRAGEVVALKVTDIDSERMVIRVEQGKGRRDRYAMLSPKLRRLLRAWWRHANGKCNMLPGGWLFPGQKLAAHTSTRQLSRAFQTAVTGAGIDKRLSLHSLRHAFATHLLESGTDIRVIQDLLGHAKIENTARYARVAARTLRAVKSPLERLNVPRPPALD